MTVLQEMMQTLGHFLSHGCVQRRIKSSQMSLLNRWCLTKTRIKRGKQSCKYVEEEQSKWRKASAWVLRWDWTLHVQETARRLVRLEGDSGGKRGWRDADSCLSGECKNLNFTPSWSISIQGPPGAEDEKKDWKKMLMVLLWILSLVKPVHLEYTLRR